MLHLVKSELMVIISVYKRIGDEYWLWLVSNRAKLVYEPGVGSGERGKRERGAGIDVRIPEMKEFY
jgi:hypothetical protein